jgi:hypothetical protein
MDLGKGACATADRSAIGKLHHRASAEIISPTSCATRLRLYAAIPTPHATPNKPLILPSKTTAHPSAGYNAPLRQVPTTGGRPPPAARRHPISIQLRTTPNMAEQTLNIPQIIVFLAVTVLIIRWFFKAPPAGQPTSAANRAARLNPAQIDQLVQMFPQLDRRTAAWNLNRAGGNAQAMTETLLAGGALEQVRASFLRSVAGCLWGACLATEALLMVD